MISHITGTVLEQSEKEVVISVSGIGYSVFTPSSLFEIGSTLSLYAHQVIREDAHELYGFQTKDERDLFRILIGISGVGPKTALGMLTLYTLSDLVTLIKTGDAKGVSLVPGIGKKTAEKIVIDLKDKMDRFSGAEGKTNSDLTEALLSLGYKEFQIRPIIGTIDTSLPIEKQITEALQKIQK